MNIEARLKALEQIRDIQPSEVSLMSDDELMTRLGLPHWRDMDHAELMNILKAMSEGEQG